MPGTFGTPCQTTVDLPRESVVYGAFSAHWKLTSNWVYGAVAINDLTLQEQVGSEFVHESSCGGGSAPRRLTNFFPYLALGIGAAHTYSTQFENTNSGRARTVAAGNGVRVAPAFWSSSGNVATVNRLGFTAFTVPTTHNQAGTFTCAPALWSYTSNTGVVTECSVTFTLPVKAVVYAEYTGHAIVNSGTCYGIVSFDGPCPGGSNMG